MYQRLFIFTVLSAVLLVNALSAQTSAFTYQGRLTDSSLPASGTYQMQFALFDTDAGGTQIGTTVENAAVTVTAGVFTVQLDFNADSFSGSDRYLEISVRTTSNEKYVILSPRQRVTSAPYAVKSVKSASADNADALGGVEASQYVLIDDTRLTNDRNPLPGSSNYIQNGNVTQQNSNFNISGDGSIGHRLFVGPLTASQVSGAVQVESGLSTSIYAHSAGGSYGVYGFTEGEFSTGVLGNSAGNGGVGVLGIGSVAGVRGVSSFFSSGTLGDQEHDAGVYGYSIFGSAGYFEGDVRVTGTIFNSSDLRLKQNINKLGYGLADVMRLRPVTWQWKARPEGSTQLGLIAQEVEKVMPELVATDKDAQKTKGVNYIGLLPILINAIQEQQKQIDQQQSQIKEQQAENTKLRKAVCSLTQTAGVCEGNKE